MMENVEHVMIRTDGLGRYRMEDVHGASGYGSSKAPRGFLGLQHTQEMIQKLPTLYTFWCREVSPPVEAGVGGDSFAALEIIYEYAAWISPEFADSLYDAFDESACRSSVQEVGRVPVEMPRFIGPR